MKYWPIVVVLLLIAAGAIYFSSQNKTSSEVGNLPLHTCTFDNESLEIECSEELRIYTGTREVLVENGNTTNDSSILCYYGGQCYRKVAVYSESSSANLRNIIAANYPDLIYNDSDIFSDYIHFIYRRNIVVKDSNTEEEYHFLVRDSKQYNVELNRGDLDTDIAFCNSAGNSDLCMPDLAWRCGQGISPDDGCNAVTANINRNNLSSDVCYELKYEKSISYCLAYTNMSQCFVYAQSNPKVKKMCETVQCKIAQRPFTECNKIYYYGSSTADCSVYYDYEDFKKVCEANPYYYNSSENCLSEFNVSKQRCLDFHSNITNYQISMA